MRAERSLRYQKHPYALLHAVKSNVFVLNRSAHGLIVHESSNGINRKPFKLPANHHLGQTHTATNDRCMVYISSQAPYLLHFDGLSVQRLSSDGQVSSPTFVNRCDGSEDIFWIEESSVPRLSKRITGRSLDSQKVFFNFELPSDFEYHDLRVNCIGATTTYEHAKLALISSKADHIFWHENKLSIISIQEPNQTFDVPAPGEKSFFAHPLWIDHQTLVYASRYEDSEGLYVFDTETSITRCIFKTSSTQQLSRLGSKLAETHIIHAKRRRSIFFVLRDEACDILMEINLKTKVLTRFGAPINDKITKIHHICLFKDEKNLAIVGSSSHYAPSLFSYDFAKQDLKVLDAVFSPKRSSHQLFHLGPRDGYAAYTLIHKPTTKTTCPLIVLIHAGPYQNSGYGWTEKAAYFNELGYAVAYINYAGSSGYGHDYAESIYGQWGSLECQQITDTIESLKKLNYIDPGKVALWGGDLGASTILNILATHQHLVTAAVCVYPILDLVDYAKTSQSLRRNTIQLLVSQSEDPIKIENALKQMSPLSLAHRIRTPLALCYGKQDKVVRSKHYDDLINEISASGGSVSVKCFETEGHQWQSHQTYEAYYDFIEEFLDACLNQHP